MGETQTLEIDIANDTIPELIEIANLSLANVSRTGIVITDTATLTIVDDDNAAPTPRLSISQPSVSEGVDDFAVVSVTLDVAVPGGFSVDLVTTDGTANSPSDYSSGPFRVTFAGSVGEVQTVSIPIVDDNVVEPSESFTLSLANASDPSIITTATSEVFISDADRATVQIDDVTVNEDDGVAIFTVTIDNAVQGGFSLNALTMDDTANSPDDYLAVDTTLVFDGLAGEQQTISVTIIDDNVPEPTQSAQILLTSNGNANVGGVGGTDAQANLNITDDDVVIDPQATITGHLFCDLNNSGDENAGEASVGVTVFLDRNGNRVADAGEEQTLTDSAGNFAFLDVQPGGVAIAAEVPAGCNTIPTNPGVTRVTIGVGELARSITAADIDQDGDQDLLVASDRSNDLTVLGNDLGSYTLDRTIALADRPHSVTTWQAADSPTASPIIAVAAIGATGQTGGLFVGPVDTPGLISSGDGSIDVAIADFNSDNQPDYVSASFRSSELRLRLSETDVSQVIATGQLIRAVTAGDINGDGNADIAFVEAGYEGEQSARIGVMIGDGTGAFSAPVFAESSRDFVEVRIADLDSDGASEILALARTGQLVTLQESDGVLQEIRRTEVDAGASAFALGDFNRDNQVDVAIANQGEQLIQFLVGNGSGQFAEITRVTDVSLPSDIVVVDTDGDGFAEVAVTNLYSNTAEPGQPPIFQLPSTVTILKLDVAEIPLTITSETVADVTIAFPSADPDLRLDATGDGEVTALDALMVINQIQPTTLLAEAESVSQPTERALTDVDGDGQTTAIDALLIINHLSRQKAQANVMTSSEEFRKKEEITATAKLFAELDNKLF